MSLIFGYQNRNLTKDIVIQNAAGATVEPGSSDVIRVVIGREGQTPVLSISSEANSANGSSFQKNTPSTGTNRLRITAADMQAIDPGVYSLLVDFKDAGDGNEWKNVSRQVFAVERT